MDTEMSAVAPDTSEYSAESHQTLDNTPQLTSTPAESAFECETCGKVFTSKHARIRHMRLHTGEKHYECHYPGCTKKFSRRDYLRNHWITHDKTVQHAFASPLGILVLKDAELDDTLRNTNETLVVTDKERKKALLAGRFPCHHCEQVFERADPRRLHTITHAGDKRHICHVLDCKISFYRLDHLQTHLKVHVEPGRSLYELREAQQAFVPTPALETATMRDAQNGRRAVDHDPEASEASLEMAAQQIGRGYIMCPHEGCGQGFDRQEGLSAHVRVHQPSGGPFKCPTCGKGLSRKDKLTTHMRRHEEEDHTSMPPQTAPQQHPLFVCHVCGYKTGRGHDLKRHLASNAHGKDIFVNIDGRGYHVKRDTRPAIEVGTQGLLEGKECGGEEYGKENAGQMKLEGDQDHGDGSNPLETFLSQLVAAANPNGTGKACKDEQSTTRVFMTDTGTGEKSIPTRIPESTDERNTESEPCQNQAAGIARTGVYVSSRSTVSARSTTVSAHPVDGAKLGRPMRTPTGAQVPHQSHPKPSASPSIASRLQGSRLCYGCGHVFWDAKIFWSHGPCFTTTAASNACDLPDRAGRMSVNTKVDAKQQPTQQPATKGRHDSGRGAMHNTDIPTSSNDEWETIINVAPSSEVQRLLVSLAKSNPEARPIPPAELRSLMITEPIMLDRVAKMKLDNVGLLD